MSKFIVLLLCHLFYSNLGAPEYEAPKSVEYPFGDEVFNSDIREDRVTECVDNNETAVDVELIKDIYTFCPNETLDDSIYDEIPFCESKCARCDVRPTVDKTGALVECYECSDASNLLTLSPEVTSSEHILFLTTYLEIGNYTATEEEAE